MVVDSYALCMGGGAAAGGGTGLRTGDQPAEPEDRCRNGDCADGFGHGDFYCAARDRRDASVAAVLIVERRGHPARESQWEYRENERKTERRRIWTISWKKGNGGSC